MSYSYITDDCVISFYKRLHNSAYVVLNTLMYLKPNFLTPLLAKYGIPSIHVSSCFVKNRMWSTFAEKAKDNGHVLFL